jgi:pyruvate-formate lyase-activating enzyme
MKREKTKLLVCDRGGNIYDHHELSMAGQSGASWVRVDEEELIPLPEGTKVFFLPGSQAVGWDEAAQKPKVLKNMRGVTAMLQAGYARTLLPAASYPGGAPDYGCHSYLPLWAYAAVGWREGKMVAAAFRVDPMTHSETCHYDDREIVPRVRKRLKKSPQNRLITHLSHCALEYHCFAAKNYFMQRWEAPLPTAMACNAACVGCISLQPSDCCPASQERIEFTPTVEELSEVAVEHLEEVERGIVSFGQGCEGEPLLGGTLLESAVRDFRSKTGMGTVHLNTNGSLPEELLRVARAGLDSVRISANSARETTYNAYYRPRSYRFEDVKKSIGLSVKEGLYTALNYLIFPGVTDLPEEVDALFELVNSTGLQMVHFRNMSIDPRLYLENLPKEIKEAKGAIGIRNAALKLKREFPRLDIGYFNRPKEEFGAPLTTLKFLEGN